MPDHRVSCATVHREFCLRLEIRHFILHLCHMASSDNLPAVVPAMTLRDTVFFPQSILPLYIFEPRYRKMLRDVLAGNRMFAVVRMDETQHLEANDEPPCAVATIGVIRASQENPDGTSNLVLQGLQRVEIEGIEAEEPYRILRIKPFPTELPEDLTPFAEARREIVQLLRASLSESEEVPTEFCDYLRGIDEPDVFLDLTAYAACPCADLKQRLLETAQLEKRFALFRHFLEQRIRRLQLFRDLQHGTRDDQISLN
jgi:Lon protease-like protein